MPDATARWHPSEDAIIRDRYAHAGPEGTRITLALAGYTRGAAAVRARASALRVRRRPIGKRHHATEPATGRAPDPNYQYFWPITFSDAFEYHPQFADAMRGLLRDDWQPTTPDSVSRS